MSGRPLRESEHMLDADAFEKVRAEICSSGPASDGDNLLGMEMDSFVSSTGHPLMATRACGKT